MVGMGGGKDEACGEACPMRGASLLVRLAWGAALLAIVGLLIATTARASDPFRDWIEALWPEAAALGVSRRTFDEAFRNLKPDTSLPDLVLPGRDAKSSRGQAEFSRPPGDYLDKAQLARLGSEGRALLVKHRAALERIEAETGVDRHVVLAIWGRETAFGKHRLPHDAITVLATQAYLGRRKELFRTELLYALKMLEAGVPRARMRASWAGAMGLTQFMPSEFFSHARDLDGDGIANLFDSVDDALASAARQLADKGWVRGEPWGFEVVVPLGSDCSLEGPPGSQSLAAWSKLGFTRAAGRSWPAALLQRPAYLMSPAGAHGPAFLVLENYQVIRRYNTSDLYATFVGNLADRIAGGGDFATPWKPIGPQRSSVVSRVQSGLKERGFPIEKIDGFIGSNTRRYLGRYQKANSLTVDCWPSEQVVKHMAASKGR